jgi:hypothetical protein
MLRIRQEQMAALGEDAMQRFKDRAVDRLRGFAPKHLEWPGETAVRRTIDLGIERAFAYGLTGETAIFFYLELMFVLGSGFDRDPMFPWAGEILTDPTIVNQYERTDRLYDELSVYLEQALGRSNESYGAALRRIQSEFLSMEVSRGSTSLEDYVADAFYRMYPEKFIYLGETVVRSVVTSAEQLARKHGITSDRGAGLVATLMFLLGSDVQHDPLYPWVAAALAQDLPLTSEQRVAQLHEGSTRALQHCLS